VGTLFLVKSTGIAAVVVLRMRAYLLCTLSFVLPIFVRFAFLWHHLRLNAVLSGLMRSRVVGAFCIGVDG